MARRRRRPGPGPLRKNFAVCRLTPTVQHWMPTREAWIKEHLSSCPDNLIIRLSMTMIDQEATGTWGNTSTVVTKNATCPAPTQSGQCGSCRNCWNPDIKNIAYGKHWLTWFFQDHKWKLRHNRARKPQAPSRKSHAPIFRKQQATSIKPPKIQAASHKHQATSNKLHQV